MEEILHSSQSSVQCLSAPPRGLQTGLAKPNQRLFVDATSNLVARWVLGPPVPALPGAPALAVGF